MWFEVGLHDIDGPSVMVKENVTLCGCRLEMDLSLLLTHEIFEASQK